MAANQNENALSTWALGAPASEGEKIFSEWVTLRSREPYLYPLWGDEMYDLELQMLKSETPEQKAKRLKAEAKEAKASEAYSRRYWDREDRKAEREAARRDHSAYRSGAQTAEKIGLDAQLKSGKKTLSL
jgi:hypothetical protein